MAAFMVLASVAALATSVTLTRNGGQVPAIEKLGTADFSMVETTPVVWKGRLLRFESVRGSYGGEPGCPTCGLQRRDPAMNGQAYFRFRDVAAPLAMTASFAAGYSFGCAFVQLGSERSDGIDTMWAFGRGANSTQITAFWSVDLEKWNQGPGVQLTGFGHTANDYEVFNNNVHKGRDKGQHIMAIELGKPSDITGAPFTSVFATHSGSDDLSTGWTFLDPHNHVYPPLVPAHGYEGACPTIRYVAATDHYYLITLHAEAGGYGEFLVRSKDLATWESAKANPILDFQGQIPADKGAAPRRSTWNYYANFTSSMEDYIAKATDINNSDIDFCDVNGSVYITYSWGNQQGTEFLGAAQVPGTTTDEWLMSYF